MSFLVVFRSGVVEELGLEAEEIDAFFASFRQCLLMGRQSSHIVETRKGGMIDLVDVSAILPTVVL